MTEPDPTELPSSTLPANLQLSLRGFDQESGFMQRFVDELSSVLLDCGRIMDLERLAGVTVGYDFDEALASFDFGYQRASEITYTNNGDVICVAKAMNVIRDGRVMSHVVYNAGFIEALVDPESEHHLSALHIVTHELGHVAELKWRDDAIPGVILKPHSLDCVSAMLLETGLVVWEEYAACRLTALFSDRQVQKQTYADTYSGSAAKAIPSGQARIKEYRTHGDIDRLLQEAGESIAMPLKLAGYLLGHLDGLGDDVDFDTLCPAHIGTPYQAMLPKLQAELRKLWDTRAAWSEMDEFTPLAESVRDIFLFAGVDLQKRDEGHYVHVPFSAETMPNGELDMLIIRMEEGTKRWGLH